MRGAAKVVEKLPSRGIQGYLGLAVVPNLTGEAGNEVGK